MVCVVDPESATVFWNLARCNIVLVVPFRVPKVTPFHFVDSQLLQSLSPSFDSSVQCAISISTYLDHQVVVFRKKTNRQPLATKTCAVITQCQQKIFQGGFIGPRVGLDLPIWWGAAEGLQNQKPCLVKAGHQLSFRQLVHWRSESAPGTV